MFNHYIETIVLFFFHNNSRTFLYRIVGRVEGLEPMTQTSDHSPEKNSGGDIQNVYLWMLIKQALTMLFGTDNTMQSWYYLNCYTLISLRISTNYEKYFLFKITYEVILWSIDSTLRVIKQQQRGHMG